MEFSASSTAARVPLARWALASLVVLPWLWPFTPGPSTNAVPMLAAWACVALSLLLQVLTGVRIAQAAPAAWLVAATVSACIALAQWAGVLPDTPLLSSAAVGEAYGNLRQRNQFASLTSIGIAAAVWTAAQAAPRRAAAAIVLLAIANAASASRTGFVQLLLLAGLAAAWPGPRGLRVALVGVAIAVHLVASAVLPWLLFEWRGIEAADVFHRALSDLGCSSRTVLWSNVVDLIRIHPWTGWGAGELDYAHFVTLYPGARFCDILDNAHNLPLHIAVEFGVPLALGVCIGLAALAWRARPWREPDAQRQLAWAALALVGFHSLLEYPLWYGPFQALVVQCVLMLLPAPAPAPAPGPGFAHRARVSAFACGLLVAVAIAAESYARVSQAYLPPDQRRAAYRVDPVRAAEGVLLFDTQRRFAELAVTPLSRENAGFVNALATEMLHYSPEPAVIEKVIDSALLLHEDEAAAWYSLRYKAAFPERYAAWMGSRRR